MSIIYFCPNEHADVYNVDSQSFQDQKNRFLVIV